jgi:hypothetical protein
VLSSGDPGNGALIDDMLQMGMGGRPVTIKSLPVGARSLTLASTLFRGRSKKITSTRPLEQFELQIADRLSDLEQPLLTRRFLGTTTGPGATAEGNADLKGKIKQRAYGVAQNVLLQPANPYDLIYLASDPGLQAIYSITVFDGAKALTNAGDFATIALLRAATTGAIGSGAAIEEGEYGTCLAAGLVRPGGLPEFALTADITVGATDADRTAAQIANQMLLDFGISGVEIVSGSFDGLDGKNSAVNGFLVDDDQTALMVIQPVLDSIGGWLFDHARRRVPGRPFRGTGRTAGAQFRSAVAVDRQLAAAHRLSAAGVAGHHRIWPLLLQAGRCGNLRRRQHRPSHLRA